MGFCCVTKLICNDLQTKLATQLQKEHLSIGLIIKVLLGKEIAIILVRGMFSPKLEVFYQ